MEICISTSQEGVDSVDKSHSGADRAWITRGQYVDRKST